MAKGKSFKDYTAFGDLSASLILKNLPFVFFLSFLAVIYIANSHYSEKKIRQIQGLQKEVKELRWHYMALKAELMFNSKESEIAKRVAPLGLYPRKGKPKKIKIKK